ncbi:MAG TPA: TMEM175 family protein [Saprospiraceae bacterium]|nr:TMEM175 family protein [Saprospiraceae bacterium]
MNTTRLEAFSDGVLAIIITIMVLEMKVPHGAAWQDLQPLIPVFLSYALSFIYIGIYWGNHHHLMHSVTKVTSGILWANLNLLFWLSLIPFSTAWMGENHFAPNTLALYSVSMLLPAIAYYILQSIVMKNHLHPDAFNEAHRKQNIKGRISLAAYSLSILFAFYLPVITGIIIIGAALIWLVPDKNFENSAGSE